MTDLDQTLTDEDLTSYLDGEADEALRARIEAASVDERLAALAIPMEDLRAQLSLDQLDAPELPAHIARAPRTLAWPAAVAAAFVAGVLVTSALRPPQAPDWIDAVAAYQVLYVEQTVGGAVQDSAATTAVIGQIEANFGIDLTAARDIEGLTLVRAQMLGFEDAPLLQMAYRADDGTPVAFCLTRVEGDDVAPTTTIKSGLAATAWVKDGIGYLMIGGQDGAFTQQAATGLI